jgi:hypothetical protein
MGGGAGTIWRHGSSYGMWFCSVIQGELERRAYKFTALRVKASGQSETLPYPLRNIP